MPPGYRLQGSDAHESVVVRCADDTMESKLQRFHGAWLNQLDRKNPIWMLSLHHHKHFVERYGRFGIEADAAAQKQIDALADWRAELLEIKAMKDVPGYKQHFQDHFDKKGNWIKFDPLQKVGALWMAVAEQCVLADSVGSGKTWTALEAFCIVADQRKNVTGAMIFSLSGNKVQWALEEGPAAYPQIKFFLVDGEREDRIQTYVKYRMYKGLKAIVLNYELLVHDFDYISDLPYQVLIADEASQKIKKRQTRTKNNTKQDPRHSMSGLFLKLRRRWTWMLTATPVENSLSDLYTIFRGARPSVFKGGWARFCAGFLELNFFGKPKATKNLEILRDIIDPFLFAREVDLGIETHAETVHIVLGPEQKKVYDQVKEMFAKQAEGGSRNALFTLLLRLRQVCNFPDIVVPEYKGPSAKLEWTIEKLKTQTHRKTIVFTQWVETANRISDGLKAAGIKHSLVTGDHKGKVRDGLLDAVKFGDCNVLISSDCLAYGKNLQYCDRLINFDFLWNPAKLKQRRGRITRRGQLNRCDVYLLVAKYTVDHKSLDKVTVKIETNKAVMGFEMGGDLDRDEIQALLEEP